MKDELKESKTSKHRKTRANTPASPLHSTSSPHPPLPPLLFLYFFLSSSSSSVSSLFLPTPSVPPAVLSDTQDSSPQPSEDMLSSQSELRSSKCPQDRELPSIPPSNALMGDGPPPSGESTYEVGLFESHPAASPSPHFIFIIIIIWILINAAVGGY